MGWFNSKAEEIKDLTKKIKSLEEYLVKKSKNLEEESKKNPPNKFKIQDLTIEIEAAKAKIALYNQQIIVLNKEIERDNNEKELNKLENELRQIISEKEKHQKDFKKLVELTKREIQLISELKALREKILDSLKSEKK